jgi:putative membrane protein
MGVADLPTLNALLNASSATLLVLGYQRIRRLDRRGHQRCMVAAVVLSALFLTSYLAYHYTVGSVPYQRYNWTRGVYFSVLVPHIVLAALIVPLLPVTLWHAWRQNFARHRRIARWLWPTWLFVCVTGIVVYVMLYLL